MSARCCPLLNTSLKEVLRHAAKKKKVDAAVTLTETATSTSHVAARLYEGVRQLFETGVLPLNAHSTNFRAMSSALLHHPFLTSTHSPALKLDFNAFCQAVTLTPMRGGNSNEMFVIRLDEATAEEKTVTGLPPPLLLRVYGTAMSHIIERESDIQATRVASESGVGPALLCCFAWGRIEEFLEGAQGTSTSTWLAADRPWHLRNVALALRQLHQSPVSAERSSTPNATLALQATLRRLLSRLKVIFNGVECESAALVVNNFISWLEEESAWIESVCAAYPVVFSHNDLNPGNILWIGDDASPQGITTKLIDFEYSGPNYRCFDLGNTLCETDYDYDSAVLIRDYGDGVRHPVTSSVDTMPGFVKPSALDRPGNSSHDPFAPHLPQRLLRAALKTSARMDDPIAHHILEQFVAVFHNDSHKGAPLPALAEVFHGMAASHLLWGLWGSLIAADGAVAEEGHTVRFPRGNSGLDYAAYAECRLREYERLKSWLLQNCVISNSTPAEGDLR